jgi:hypothetical protein
VEVTDMTNPNRKSRKLSLSRDTLRWLATGDLDKVGGAANTDLEASFCVCASKSICLTCAVC